MEYSDIDPTIAEWTARRGFQLCKEFGGVPRRFFYISGGQHESFQISVERPENDRVSINAWSVETEDDAELHHAWIVPIEGLTCALQEALEKVQEWRSRPKHLSVFSN